jgi:hypothetical protein
MIDARFEQGRKVYDIDMTVAVVIEEQDRGAIMKRRGRERTQRGSCQKHQKKKTT